MARDSTKLEKATNEIRRIANSKVIAISTELSIAKNNEVLYHYITEAILCELIGTGVKVCALCPGPVKTNWSKNAGRSDSIFSLNAMQVAREVFYGMHSGKWLIILSIHHRCFKYMMDIVSTLIKIRCISILKIRCISIF